MSIVDKVKQIFHTEETNETEQEELSLKPEEAVELVENTSEEKLEKIRDREQHLIKETDQLLDELKQNLEKVDEYEDIDGIKAAEDIAESFYNSRKIMLENFKPEKDTESYQEQLQQFLTQFNDVDRKEKALMDRMKSDVTGIAQNVQRLDEKLSDLDEFNSNALQYRKDVAKLRKLHSELEELYKDENNLEGEIKDAETDIQHLKTDIEEADEKIAELKDSEDWKQKSELQDEMEKMRKDRKQIKQKLSSTVSGLDRGLKKLIYQIENQGLDFSGDKSELVKLREENFSELEMMQKDLERAQQKIEDEELLTGRQFEDFKQKVEEEVDFVEEAERIQQKKDEIKELQDRISELEVVEKKSGLEERLEKLQDEHEELKEELENYQSGKEEIEQEIADKKQSIEQQTEKLLQKPVQIQ